MPDGVTFVRDAVLRPSVDPRRPVIALLWQEGARPPLPPTPRRRRRESNGGGYPATETNGKYLANLGGACAICALALGLPAFWRWWTRELAPLVPAAPRAAVKRRRLRPVLAFGPMPPCCGSRASTDGALAYSASRGFRFTGDADGGAHAGRAAIDSAARAAERRVRRRRRSWSHCRRGQVLRKRSVLPAAVEENLQQTLAYDLDRHTPFKPDELCFDATVVGRDAQRKRDPRRLGGGAAHDGGRGAAARGELGRDGRRASRPIAPGDEGPATPALALNLLPADGAPDGRVVAAVAASGFRFGADRTRRARRDRAAAVAEARVRDRADRRRPSRRACRPTLASALRKQLETAHRRLQLRARQEVRASRARCRCSRT